MNTEEKKNELIKARNIMTNIFNNSKEDWGDNWWCSSLCEIMGELDVIINLKIGKPKLTGLKAI